VEKKIAMEAQPLPPELSLIHGAQELFAWFGYWPSFHDAEIIELHLDRKGVSSLKIETWEMTKETDERGFYKLAKRVLVTFLLKGVSNCDLTEFNHQNVISGLSAEKTAEGYRLTLYPCFGLNGTIEVAEVAISFEPSAAS
jgi:hypothetical protein